MEQEEVGVFGEIQSWAIAKEDNTEKKFLFLCRDYKPTLLQDKNV